MKRDECGLKLLEIAGQMYEVYREYAPAGDMLSISLAKNGNINIFDGYFNMDGKLIINENGTMFHTIDATRYSDGQVSSFGKFI